MSHLDSDLLRTFLAVAETGSVTGGARRIHRSQSAASVRIQQLEALLGGPVFERHGRGIRLSPSGERLLPVARQVVDVLDRTLTEHRGDSLAGTLDVGVPDDQGTERLSDLLAAFARSHPGVRLTVHRALSSGFSEALARGELDLAILDVERLGPRMTLLSEERMLWATSRTHAAHHQDPLPVALFDRACWWRDAALTALEQSGRRYRVAYSSESVSGVVAALQAGIAIGVLGADSLRGDLVAVPAEVVPGALPTSRRVLETGPGPDTPPRRAMGGAILEAFAAALAGGSHPPTRAGVPAGAARNPCRGL